MANTKTQLIVRKGGGAEEQELVELAKLCRMMKLMSERDTDATLAQVLKTMLEHSRSQPVGGSELSKMSGLNRITVIHHMKRLESAGFVRRQETKYVLRVQSAEEMLLEFRKEMEREFEQMDELAREIDRFFDEESRPGARVEIRRVREKKF
ncbi:Uncharacterised protein [uncultured archaeon]|nr:Uncharacterised protein [uncultured archaeon]